jgi:hypothetical protein
MGSKLIQFSSQTRDPVLRLCLNTLCFSQAISSFQIQGGQRYPPLFEHLPDGPEEKLAEQPDEHKKVGGLEQECCQVV